MGENKNLKRFNGEVQDRRIKYGKQILITMAASISISITMRGALIRTVIINFSSSNCRVLVRNWRAGNLEILWKLMSYSMCRRNTTTLIRTRSYRRDSSLNSNHFQSSNSNSNSKNTFHYNYKFSSFLRRNSRRTFKLTWKARDKVVVLVGFSSRMKVIASNTMELTRKCMNKRKNKVKG